jgi:hypothetical protein
MPGYATYNVLMNNAEILGEGTQRKPPTFPKPLTNLIT